MPALASVAVIAAFEAISAEQCLFISCDVDDASQRAIAFMGFYVHLLLLFGFWVLFVPSCIFFRFLLYRMTGAAQSLLIGVVPALLLFSFGVSGFLFVPGLDDFDIVFLMVAMVVFVSYGSGVMMLMRWGNGVFGPEMGK